MCMCDMPHYTRAQRQIPKVVETTLLLLLADEMKRATTKVHGNTTEESLAKKIISDSMTMISQFWHTKLF